MDVYHPDGGVLERLIIRIDIIMECQSLSVKRPHMSKVSWMHERPLPLEVNRMMAVECNVIVSGDAD